MRYYMHDAPANNRVPAGAALLILTLLAAPALRAAELRPETLAYWEQYVQSADQAMQARLRPGHAFLWIDESPERRRQVRDGEILVSGVGEPNPKKVPSGLIHHWIGAVFVPHARLDDVLTIVRDYGHYRDYYHPTVIEARTMRQSTDEDRFTMLLLNKSLLLKTALDSEYSVSYTSRGDSQCYSVSTATRLQEIDDFGQSRERELPPDEGSGYIWRLHSIARYEESDGGVYVEMEAMALSRDIPSLLRWVVEPIVRRVSQDALATSLKQTQAAVMAPVQLVSSPSAISRGNVISGFVSSRQAH